MVKYLPLEDVRLTLGVDPVDLLKVEPGLNSLSASFILADEAEQDLQVTFDRPTIVRVLDDMPLSTEGAWGEGRVPNHFAYEVRGHPFLTSQSQVWRDVCGPISHYQFLTGGMCMDVLSSGQPEFSLVPADKDALVRREQREADDA